MAYWTTGRSLPLSGVRGSTLTSKWAQTLITMLLPSPLPQMVSMGHLSIPQGFATPSSVYGWTMATEQTGQTSPCLPQQLLNVVKYKLIILLCLW